MARRGGYTYSEAVAKAHEIYQYWVNQARAHPGQYGANVNRAQAAMNALSSGANRSGSFTLAADGYGWHSTGGVLATATGAATSPPPRHPPNAAPTPVGTTPGTDTGTGTGTDAGTGGDTGTGSGTDSSGTDTSGTDTGTGGDTNSNQGVIDAINAGNAASLAQAKADRDTSAHDAIYSFLGQYGLGDLASWAWNEYQNGVPVSQIMLDMRDQPLYKQRFPAMEALSQQGRAINEAQYIQMENSYRDVLHSYGLPSGFYDSHDDFAKWMIGSVSPTELNTRVQDYTQAVTGDPETIHQLQTLYNTYGHDQSATGALLAHFIDPDAALPILDKQLKAAQFATAGQRTGWGQVTQQQAEQYGSQYSGQQAAQGFNVLGHEQQLFTALPGERGQSDLGQDVQLGAAFGQNTADQQAVENRAALRVSELAGANHYTQGRSGNSGLAAVDQV